MSLKLATTGATKSVWLKKDAHKTMVKSLENLSECPFYYFSSIKSLQLCEKKCISWKVFFKGFNHNFQRFHFFKSRFNIHHYYQMLFSGWKVILMKLPVNHERYFNEQWTKVCCIETNLRDCYEQRRLNYSNAVHVYRDDSNNLDLRKVSHKSVGGKKFYQHSDVFHLLTI